MKMQYDHYETIFNAIEPLDTPETRELYTMAGLSDTRYRWDLLRASGVSWCGDGVGTHSDLDLYAYLNDSHIATALKAMILPLQ